MCHIREEVQNVNSLSHSDKDKRKTPQTLSLLYQQTSTLRDGCEYLLLFSASPSRKDHEKYHHNVGRFDTIKKVVENIGVSLTCCHREDISEQTMIGTRTHTHTHAPDTHTDRREVTESLEAKPNKFP